MNYIGSKLSLLPFINEAVSSLDIKKKPEEIVFCDIFAGTGVVSKFFKEKGYNIIANDLQYYSYVILKHLVGTNRNLRYNKLRNSVCDDIGKYLNNLNGIDGFIYNNYSPSGTKTQEHQRLYFSDYNARKIDAMRLQIESWYKDKLLDEDEYYGLLASLLESSDKVANTASVYEAFLKKFKKTSLKELDFQYIKPTISDNLKFKSSIHNKDANSLIEEIKGDILYLDPPYNTRKYNTNYHMLETISLYDNPTIKGKTGVRDDESKKSDYSSRRFAKKAFEDLIKKASFDYILLSYNNEGIISVEDIQSIMSKYGQYTVLKKPYRRFKADSNRNNGATEVLEYIHILRKNCN